MRFLAILRMRLRSLLRRADLERELADELAFDRAAGGPEPGAAVGEACRETRGFAAIENFAADLRRAARRLAGSPGFSATAVVVLALGVAAATAMFSLCNAALLEPLPGIADARGLVHLERWDKGVLLGDFSYPGFQDYRNESRSYESLAALAGFVYDVAGSQGVAPKGSGPAAAGRPTSRGSTVSGLRAAVGRPSPAPIIETLDAELVSVNYFATLGVKAELGRVFTPSDRHTVVVSDHYWRSRLGANPHALGRTLTANHVPLTIIGVAPPGFRGAQQSWRADLWAPITLQPQLSPMGDAGGNCLTTRQCGWVTIFGRLRPGVSRTHAQTEADAIAARIATAHPEIKGRHAAVVPGLGSWSDDRATQASFLTLLLAGTLVVAAMTCASLGSLFLARMGGRQHEVATQLALGASRWRVGRQFVMEAAWVAAAGALLGGAAAAPLARALLQLAPAAPVNLAIIPNLRIWAFAAALAALSALAVALAPALLAARRGALNVGNRATARHAAQRAMLAAQVGLALILLMAAAVTARALRAATAGQVPAGASHIVLARVDTGHALAYTRVQDAAFFQQLRSRLAAQPGMQAVALTGCLAPAPCNRGPVFVAGTEPPEAVVRAREFLNTYPRPDIDWISPDYFQVFGVPILAGRNFTSADRSGAPLVCIINQSLAARLWPHQAALGQRLAWPQFNYSGDHDFTVVGVAADRRAQSLLAPAPLYLFVPAAQVPFPAYWVAAQSPLPAAATLAAMRAQVRALDPRIPVERPLTLAAAVRRSLWQPLAIAALAGCFGLLAALLAAIGLFGTLAQLVQERRHELGVRLALGATPSSLTHMVVGDCLPPLALGLAAGTLASLVALRALRPWLFGVTPADPVSWASAAALLASVALAGAWLAARRAASLSPLTALRSD